jgi:hypothetical protein
MYCGGGHLGFPIGIKNIKFVEDLPMIIPGQFGFNCPSGFREDVIIRSDDRFLNLVVDSDSIVSKIYMLNFVVWLFLFLFFFLSPY